MFEWSKTAKTKKAASDRVAEWNNVMDALSLDEVDERIFFILALESEYENFAPFFISYHRLESVTADRRALLRSLENLSRLGYITYEVVGDGRYNVNVIGERVLHDYESSFEPRSVQVEEVTQVKESAFEFDSTSINIGVVYLLRAGLYFKIGKTTDLKARLTKLAIQLPQKPELVHSIKTDNIHWLEKHWHRYFSGKRMNGEWFELDEADVSEFCAMSFVKLSNDD